MSVTQSLMAARAGMGGGVGFVGRVFGGVAARDVYKRQKYRTLMQTKPELAVKVAVRGMMPRNVITKDSLTRLHIYRGGEHQHAAQKPELWAAE